MENENIVKETYWSRFAGNFETMNNYVVGKKDIDVVKNTLTSFDYPGKVLELGCGNGTFSKIMSSKARQLFATDFSDEMVNVSRERLKEYNNITVEKQDCFNLLYKDSMFNHVVMINLFHIITNPLKAVEECRRVLAENGELVLVSFTMEGMSFLKKIGMIYRYLKTYGKPPKTAHSYKCNEVSSMIESKGFSIVESKLIGMNSKAFFIRAVKI